MSVLNSSSDNKRPELSKDEAIKLAEAKYGIKVTSIEELNGYDDRNFKLEADRKLCDNKNIKDVWPHGYVLKVINAEDSKNLILIEAGNCLMLHLHKHSFNVPVPILNKDGNLYSLEELASSPRVFHAIKMLRFEPGFLLNDSKPSAELYENVGIYMADIDSALESFEHEAYRSYNSLWALENVTKIRRYYYAVRDQQLLQLVEQYVAQFEQQVLPLIPVLERGIIHGDFNEQNLLITEEGTQIKALLDFGDAHYSPYLFELAICICYMLIHSKDISYGQHIINGYRKRRKLTADEERLIKICVCARLCQSLVLGLHSHKIYKNKYVLSTQQVGWELLRKLDEVDELQLRKLWQLTYTCE